MIYLILLNLSNSNSVPSAYGDILDNTIEFGTVSNNTTNFFYGIRLENSDGFIINGNEISKQNNVNPTIAVVDNLRGISLLKSPNNTVADNTVTKMGAGIRALGSCTNATLACNILDRNFHGFKFEGPADISYQLPGAIPTGNVWTTLPGVANDIDGAIFPGIEWYFNGPLIDAIVNPGSFTSGTPIFSNLNAICSTFPLQAPIDEREFKLGSIVRNEKQFFIHANEFDKNDKHFAYKFLKEKPSYLNLGTSDDSTYQNFMTNYQNYPIGKFNKVHELILADSLNDAQTENLSITTTIDWDYNYKRVNEIYLLYLGYDSITASDSIELIDIAWQNILDGGPGVTMARSILNYDIEDLENGTTRTQFEEESLTEAPNNSVFVYPNPSRGEFTIQSDSSLNGSYITLMDITGKIVYSNTIVSEENNFQLKVDLPSGIYTLQIKNKDEWIKILKIAIN